MRRDTILKNFRSSFLSCEKDTEEILKKLFMTSKPYSDRLKRLLVINTKDCLDVEGTAVDEILKEHSVAVLRQKNYIKLAPKLEMPEHEEVKAYIIISFDNFTPNAENDYYRDCTVTFDIICHTDSWELTDYRLRPLQIAGYIDGILNGNHLSGIGTFNFMGCNELILNEDLSGYTLSYRAIHGNDDRIPPEV